jgi:uncharacterized RDD family membrane protein YckC
MSEEWYVGRGGRQTGPFTLQQLRQMAASGQLSKADLIWKDGFPNWVPYSSVTELFSSASGVSPTSLHRPTPRPTAPPPSVSVRSEEGLGTSEASTGADPGWAFQTTPNAATIPGAPLQLAEFLPRVGAALLDGLFVSLIGCIPNGVIVGLLLAAINNNRDNAEALAFLANIFTSAIGFLIGVVYCVTLDASAKQGTWGKQIVGLRVTDLDGRRLSIGRAIGRFFARYLTICTCGIGYLLPLFTQKRQTLHDLICGCIVVNK